MVGRDGGAGGGRGGGEGPGRGRYVSRGIEGDVVGGNGDDGFRVKERVVVNGRRTNGPGMGRLEG